MFGDAGVGRRACRIVGLNRSPDDYRSQARDQTALRLRIRDLATSRVCYGYRRIHVLLRRERWKWYAPKNLVQQERENRPVNQGTR